MEEVFEKVENILRNYPPEFSKNYYDNKKTVKIKEEKQVIKNNCGYYDNDKNEIRYSKFEALPHELFHMAFRCKDNLGKEIIKDSGLYYGNGVSFIKYVDDKPQYYQLALTEGFAEYLSRKCCNFKGQIFNYYFTNLLISIYGEDILKYPLTNDSYGLIHDSRFSDIIEYGSQLDKLYDAKQTIDLLDMTKDFFRDIKDKKDILELISIFQKTQSNYISSIINLFECIIKEYTNYPKNLSKKQFIKMLEEFLENPDYSNAFAFDDVFFGLDSEYVSLKNELNLIINKFKKKSRRLFFNLR